MFEIRIYLYHSHYQYFLSKTFLVYIFRFRGFTDQKIKNELQFSISSYKSIIPGNIIFPRVKLIRFFFTFSQH